MAPEKAPAFQFYPRDMVADMDTVVMSLEELGAYTLLLCHGWLKDGLPDDETQLLRLITRPKTRGHTLRDTLAVVLAKFPVYDDGRRRNPRQEEVRAEQRENRETGSEHGAKGARARWGRRGKDAPAMPEQCPSNAQPMPSDDSASATASAVQIPTVSDQRFAQFWDAYPKKVGKADARRIFARLKVSDALLEIMLAAIAVQAASEQWQKERGQYIPNPATWLHQGRWDDEVGTTVPQPVHTWKVDCRELHGGACLSLQEHEQRGFADARKARTA